MQQAHKERVAELETNLEVVKKESRNYCTEYLKLKTEMEREKEMCDQST
jgi:hypothetical protein